MANLHENLASTNKIIPPSEEEEDQNNEFDDRYTEDDDEDQDTLLAPPSYSSCGNCLQGLLPSRWCGGGWRRRSDKAGPRRHLLHQQRQEEEEEEDDDQVPASGGEDQVSWLAKSWKKVKEPKWKNFTRRFGRSCNGVISSKKRRVQFHYDPQSYALNFDDAIDREADSTFSGRYADPLGMTITKANY
ncbi:hypothetical protein PanWU01x14_074350 [Parasponia andersonii]|uniref:Uncharacterized protein n=1 Tax=Parasponia andersonii TaxID=3476 RepID=A0A2P5DDC0_PARAD|nr:hypothetical protein PanWU01x14_074350 [Parasponia andersonii]